MYLNAHTYYSLKYGTLSPEDLVAHGRARDGRLVKQFPMPQGLFRPPLARVDPVVGLQRFEQLAVVPGHLAGLFKKCLGRHCKEFSRIGRAVVIHQGAPALPGILLQLVEFPRERRSPCAQAVLSCQDRRTVGAAGLTIELMRELVQHRVATIVSTSYCATISSS